jgi:hypothetical protein
MLVTQLTEQHAADNAPPRISSNTVAKLALKPATVCTNGSM